MVSTRQGTTKFSVGETVLCYEPDTSKAKVLYESKILEVDITKDEKGRKVPEYFVHFSGWNKSWDRWVLEDQVLPGNEVNRLKMKRLHEEAVNRIKGKRKRKNFPSHSDSLQVPSSGEVPSPGETSCAVPSQPPVTAPSSPLAPSIEIEIPTSLKLRLEDDCYFIKRRKKLVHLPRSPNVLDILKQYIDHFAQDDHSAADNQSGIKIVKEVMDGLRIYFDFTLPSLLLYNFERDQYEQVMGVHAQKEAVPSSGHEELKESSDQPLSMAIKEEDKEKKDSKSVNSEQEKTNTIKLRSASLSEKTDEHAKQVDDKSSDRVLRRRSKRQRTSVTTAGSSSPSVSSAVSSSGGEREESCQVGEHVPEKRLRKNLNEIPSNEDRIAAKPVGANVSAKLPSSTTFCTAPSQVYGVEHLLRLFVKLPSLLAKAAIQENRRSLLLQHLTDFLKYLSSRTNVLFSEDAYQDSSL